MNCKNCGHEIVFFRGKFQHITDSSEYIDEYLITKNCCEVYNCPCTKPMLKKNIRGLKL